ncbi:SGNH/GDSL hydrolase family protein [Microbacterium sp. SORGH_AS_0888]|uniref:SGNH/GDSL hydrolase family protein n=1 Tax=Microbacterium sp. SORGH_AS_0888 TaxID=3041791 RepID=UPI002786710A|nr:GDSL-type esterase/lipase family protein [Microbacterium sp. SORGH_AS_0888]MDQ1129909.1 lysophospholipase L1-like esterase [Microbacterium sp. SORGH_AS_0888]
MRDTGGRSDDIECHDTPTLDELIHALEDVAGRARAAGLDVILATIIPFLPAAGFDAAREEIRVAVNEWMRRHSGAPVIDFDAALRDAAAPGQLAPAYNGGDHVHPSSDGLDRMADEAARVIATTVRGGSQR